MSSDGSADSYASVMVGSFVVIVLGVTFGIATWLHVRSETRKNAACESRGGVRIDADKDYCIRKDALIDTATSLAGPEPEVQS